MHLIRNNFVANTAGKTRHEELHGQDYLVVPTGMMAPGVWTGSDGPGLYEEADLRNAVPTWNSKPVVVYHPELNGQPISGSDPVVLNTRQVGQVLNTSYEDKQACEVWLNVLLCNKVDDRIIPKIEAGEKIEVSTGLYVDKVKQKGKFGDKEYKFVTRNHRPDHLAILPDKVGAFSIADGGGLLNNQGDPSKPLLTLNLLSFAEISMGLCDALCSANGKPGISWMGWISNVYDQFVIYYENGEYYKQSYTATDTGVTLIGKPIQVIRVTEYRTADGAYVSNAALGSIVTSDKGTLMNTKKEKVDFLIGNAESGYAETERAFLSGIPDDQLDKIVANVKKAIARKEETPPPTPTITANTNPAPAPAPVVAPVVNAPAKVPTLEEYINAAPPELREPLTNSVLVANAMKAELIAGIIANKQNQYTEQELNGKSIVDLRKLSMSMAPAVDPAQVNNQALPPNFFGAMGAAPRPATGAPVVNGAPLSAPTMNWD